MTGRSDTSTKPRKSRRQRPPRGKGLRTSTGCLTCRTRRVKCDEGTPQCGLCAKGGRDCSYGASAKRDCPSESDVQPLAGSQPPISADNPPRNHALHPNDIDSLSIQNEIGANDYRILASQEDNQMEHDQSTRIAESRRSPANFFRDEEAFTASASVHSTSPLASSSKSTRIHESSPGTVPFEWYDLLAQDALDNIGRYSFLFQDRGTASNTNDCFPARLGQPIPTFQQPFVEPPIEPVQFNLTRDLSIASNEIDPSVVREPWNNANSAVLNDQELKYMRYYIEVVGPILDIFDPLNNFTNLVPRLAMENTGILKSMLAVAARHSSLHAAGPSVAAETSPDIQTSSSSIPTTQYDKSMDARMAAQYYYETLSYLSRAMRHPRFVHSTEIIPTAILISSYEMFDGSTGTWERHLKGAFWIQYTQESGGEARGLRNAAWWVWLQQDVWAAYRHRRKTLTIWKPSKPIRALTEDELATRVLYILAKVVEYCSDEAKQEDDFSKRIQKGDSLLATLNEWHSLFSRAIRLINKPASTNSNYAFNPIWIHPPSYAAAMQMYCFAKIAILLNRPTIGGIKEFHECQNMLDDAVTMICSIAQAPHATQPPLAFVNVQCLFVAGQCARTPEQKSLIIELLHRMHKVIKFPAGSLVEDLRKLWGAM